MKYSSFILITVLLFCFAGEAAVKKDNLNVELSNIISQLSLPRKNRVMSLRKTKGAKSQLVEIANDGEQTLQLRWRAITSLGEAFPVQSTKDLVAFVQRDEWFLRNAAIIAFSFAEREHALKWSKHLLSDKSLIVRTAAVQTIKKIDGQELLGELWEKLNDPENFYKGKSLWIRKYIAEVLSSYAQPGQETHFLKLLLDNDERLHPYAMNALKKIVGPGIGKTQKVPDTKVAWINYFKENL